MGATYSNNKREGLNRFLTLKSFDKMTISIYINDNWQVDAKTLKMTASKQWI